MEALLFLLFLFTLGVVIYWLIIFRWYRKNWKERSTANRLIILFSVIWLPVAAMLASENIYYLYMFIIYETGVCVGYGSHILYLTKYLSKDSHETD